MTLGQRDICQFAVPESSAAASLTARQAEVLRLAGHGLSGKQIARQLGISVRTVEDHFSAMRQRTGARNQNELIAYGAAAGLVQPGLAVPETVISGTSPPTASFQVSASRKLVPKPRVATQLQGRNPGRSAP